MSILWEKSAGWWWLVQWTRDLKPFFFTFVALCGIVPDVTSYAVMQFTSSRNEQLEAHLCSTAHPETKMRCMMGQVNRERLAELLGELQRKEDTNDRYVAALKGETLTRKRYDRIQPVNVPATQEDAKANTQENAKAK
ncbi:uncharacterized protein LOC133917501 [Phragmites australis]|uniref:uncharacterized protein LOC133917501 n=1 Tax=Phragmites australis TaxID=29695 RepID=UPI002D7951EA|nr:uncharacterized protein LOC133917501 [Phragmites australis]